MEFHEAANIFPMITGADFAALRDDIKTNGQLEPIILCDGKILDGRNRYAACLDVGIEPAYQDYSGEQTPLDYVISKNLHRRHLDATQRAVAANEITNLPNHRPKISGSIDPLITQQEAAKIMNVSVPTIRRVKEVKRKAPKLMPKLKSGEMTVNKALKAIKKEERQMAINQQIAEIEAGAIVVPTGLFDVISIDPPWPYGTDYDPYGRRAANPYPEMSLEQIKGIELPASPDCVVWLWTTHKFMRYSFEILDVWGFRDVAILTWVKDRMGLGSWLRSQSEFCIMAVRGKPEINLTNQTTVIGGPLREHSRKPDEFYTMVDSLCFGRKLDYFSRQDRPGWACFGNDTGRFQ